MAKELSQADLLEGHDGLTQLESKNTGDGTALAFESIAEAQKRLQQLAASVAAYQPPIAFQGTWTTTFMVEPRRSMWDAIKAAEGMAIVEPGRSMWDAIKAAEGMAIVEPRRSMWDAIKAAEGTAIVEPRRSMWDAIKAAEGMSQPRSAIGVIDDAEKRCQALKAAAEMCQPVSTTQAVANPTDLPLQAKGLASAVRIQVPINRASPDRMPAGQADCENASRRRLWFVETNAVATLPRELGAADTCASETSKPGAPGEALDLAELPEQLIVCSLRSLSEYSIDHELLYETHLHLRRVYLASDSCGAAEWTEHDWERAHSKIVN